MNVVPARRLSAPFQRWLACCDGRVVHKVSSEGGVLASMRAIVQVEYGLPEVLQDKMLPVPVPKEGELLVRIYAASVNPTDVKVSEGKGPKFGAPGEAFILGTDAAGEVVEIGQGCGKFKIGDHVFFAGERLKNMANAEYCVVSAKLCGSKPKKANMGRGRSHAPDHTHSLGGHVRTDEDSPGQHSIHARCKWSGRGGMHRHTDRSEGTESDSDSDSFAT